MSKPISQFFADLGFPLKNIRWSWGAKNVDGTALLLRAWDDEYSFKHKTVTALREPERYLVSDSYGLDERIVQLKELWAGGIAAYVVIATVKDADEHPREIKDYREDAVFSVERLSLRDDGAIVAQVSGLVEVESLARNIATHRVAAAEGIFPVDDAQRTGLSTDSYKQKLPAIRAWLTEVCQAKETVTYADVMNRFGLTFYPLRNAMSRLGNDCKVTGEPIITALIVDKHTGRCSQGLFDEFHIDDDALERKRCYAYWGARQEQQVSAKLSKSPAESEKDSLLPNDLKQRAARFAQVEVRPQQAEFRLAVFESCRGRCLISGCTVPEALEAAHLLGRDWRLGHNRASDGLLLRRDLHTLYDRGLLRITDEGVVEIDARISSHYGYLDGVQLATVKLPLGH